MNGLSMSLTRLIRLDHLVLFSLLGAQACAAHGVGPQEPEACTAPGVYIGAPRFEGALPELGPEAIAGIEGEVEGDLVEALNAEFDSLLARYPAVSVAVAIPGVGVWSSAGVGTEATSGFVTDTTPFRAASITKAVVSVVTLQLVGEGRIRLTDRVARWFPDLPGADAMTVEQLLNHTNGLVSCNALPDGGPDLDDTYRPPDELIALASGYAALFCPGTRWSYTNTGYVVLGRILERVTGSDLAELIDLRIVRPLGLRSTTLVGPATAGDGVPSGHAGGSVVDASVPAYATAWASGSLVSTAEDLVRFWHAVLSGALLPTDAVRTSFEGAYPMQPQFPAPPGTSLFYGRGAQITAAPSGQEGPGLLLEHSGGITGFNAIVAYAAEDGVFISVMTNDEQVPTAAGLWRVLQVVRDHRDRHGRAEAQNLGMERL